MVSTTLLFRNDTQTPLGRVTVAGLIGESQGVGAPRRLGSYALVYLIEGSGRYRDALNHDQRVQAGDLLLLLPELAHTYGPEPGERWSELYVVFDGPAFDLLRERGLFNTARPVLRLLPIDHWLARFEQALPQPGSATLAERLRDISRFIQLTTEIAALHAEDATSVPPHWVAAACQMLGEHLRTPLQAQEIAARLGVPYETFRKGFQQYVGVAPGRYRSIRRIDAACTLLHASHLPNHAIAAQLGFADEFHFARRFKQITGLTPRAFRRQLPGERL